MFTQILVLSTLLVTTDSPSFKPFPDIDPPAEGEMWAQGEWLSCLLQSEALKFPLRK